MELDSYPYVLQVQGDVPDERLDEPLLQPEPLLGFVKGFVFDLGQKTRRIRTEETASELPDAAWRGRTCGEMPVRCLR